MAQTTATATPKDATQVGIEFLEAHKQGSKQETLLSLRELSALTSWAEKKNPATFDLHWKTLDSVALTPGLLEGLVATLALPESDPLPKEQKEKEKPAAPAAAAAAAAEEDDAGDKAAAAPVVVVVQRKKVPDFEPFFSFFSLSWPLT